MKKLFIITLTGYLNALSTIYDDDQCKAILLNLQDSNYELKNGRLFYEGEVLTEEEEFNVAADPTKNKPIANNVIIYGLFSFLYKELDLRNNWEFTVTEKQLCSYLGISSGSKGFRVMEKLKELCNIFGIIEGRGTFPMLQVEEQIGGIYLLKSRYFNVLINSVICDCYDKYGDKGKYYTDKLHANIVGERSHTAALIAIELTRLFARTGRYYAHIRLRGLCYRVPHLLPICTSQESRSYRNRQLKRAFEPLAKILYDKADFCGEMNDFEILIPKLNIENPDAVINLVSNGYKKAKKGKNKYAKKRIY